MVLEFDDFLANYYPMNSTDTNAGGWNSIEQLRTIMNSGEIWSLIPQDLKDVLKEVKVKTMNGGNQSGVTLVETSNKLFLPAEREIFASRRYSAQTEWDALTRYQLYANNDTASFRIKKNNSTKTAYYWWLRSANSTNAVFFVVVNNNGNVDNDSASNSDGISPFFAF